MFLLNNGAYPKLSILEKYKTERELKMSTKKMNTSQFQELSEEELQEIVGGKCCCNCNSSTYYDYDTAVEEIDWGY